MKKIIIQGDDWGYKPEADKGIELAYERGILTQTTVMVNQLDKKEKESYRKRIASLKNKTSLEKPKLGIGVHLNLTYGKPLSPDWPQEMFTRPLKGSGKSEEWQGSTWREYFKQFTKKQVENEYRKQIELALEIFGKITHLDSHQMTASYKPMLGLYMLLAKEYDLPVRPIAPLSENPVYGGDFIVDENINETLKDKGIRMPDKNVFTLFFNKKEPKKSFLNEVKKVRNSEVVEFMFHPASGVGAEDWRTTDYKTLTDKKTINVFDTKDIKLVNYNEV